MIVCPGFVAVLLFQFSPLAAFLVEKIAQKKFFSEPVSDQIRSVYWNPYYFFGKIPCLPEGVTATELLLEPFVFHCVKFRLSLARYTSLDN